LKRPVVVITIGYIIGILMGLYCNISITSIYFISFIIYSIIKIYKQKNKRTKKFKLLSIKRYVRYIKILISKSTIVLFCIVSSISNLIVINLNNKYDNLYINIEDEIEVIGIVCSNKKEKQYKDVYKLKIETIDSSNKYKNTYVFLNISKNSKLEYGDKIKIKGEFVEPDTQKNYKGFNYKEYLKTIKVYGTIKSKSAEVIEKGSENIIFTKANDIFLKIKNNIETIYSKSESSVLLGIMLGYTDDIDEDIKEAFSNCNVSHILAVSGMHISYIILGLSIVLNKGMGRRKSKILTIIVLIMYMFITGFSPSIVRSGIMGILMLTSFIIYRKNDIWTSIAISMLVILIYNPFLIQNIGLILSYGGTIGIILFQKNIYLLLEKIRFKKSRKIHKQNEKIVKIIDKLKEIISVMLSAQIVLMPIIVSVFNKIGISFFIVSILVSIIIGPIVILGFIQIILLLISVNLSRIVSYFLNKFIKVLILIINFGNNIPLNKIYVKTPEIYQVVIYYIGIFLVNYFFKIFNLKYLNPTQKRFKNLIHLIKYQIREKKDKLKKYIVILISLIVVFNIIPKNLKIYFVDVGQGDSTLIVTPQNKTILIDGGGSKSSEFDIGKQVLLPYLLDRKITKIDYMIISHFDQDHVRTDYLQLCRN
jgi:competence protein ComEC